MDNKNDKIIKNFDFLDKESEYYETNELQKCKNKLREIIQNIIIDRKDYSNAGIQIYLWTIDFLKKFDEIEINENEKNIDGSEFINKFTDKLPSNKRNTAKIRNSLFNIYNIRNDFAHNYNLYSSDIQNEKLQILWQLKNLHLTLKLLLEISDNENFKWEDEKNNEKESNYLDSNTMKTINVSKKNILSIFSKKDIVFKIPIYQRKYNWKEDNIYNLLSDIDKRNKDSQEHYFGSIAWKEDKLNNNYKIIDGQQRLTSSFLIIIAYLDIMKSKFKKTAFENETIFPIVKLLNNKYHKLFDNPGSSVEANNEFKSIVTFESDELNQANKGNYLNNYLQIKNYLIDNFSSEIEITTYINSFLEKFNFSIINFENSINKKELEIFDNLNSKGMSLSFSDLIKNKILNFCSEELLVKKEVELITEYNSFTAKLNNDGEKLDGFFKALISYSTGKETSENRHKNLDDMDNVYYDLLNIPKKSNIESLKEFKDLIINKLSKYAEIYKDFLNATSGGKKINPHYGILSYLDTYHFFKYLDKKKSFLFINLYFFLLDFYLHRKINLLNQYEKIAKNELNEILDINFIFSKGIVKHFVLEGQGDSSFARNIFKGIGKLRKEYINSKFDIKSIKKEIKKIFNEDCKLDYKRKGEFKEDLISLKKDTWIAKILLKLCEWNYSEINKTGSNENWNDNEDSLEHIIPQNPDAKYKEDFDDEFEVKLLKYKNSLGNFLMLNQKMNAKESNNNFLKKNESYGKKCNSAFLYRNKENSTINISDKTVFKFDEVKSRTDEIAKYIVNEVYKDFY